MVLNDVLNRAVKFNALVAGRSHLGKKLDLPFVVGRERRSKSKIILHLYHHNTTTIGACVDARKHNTSLRPAAR